MARGFSIPPVANVSLLRVSFASVHETRWDVLVAANASGPTEFVVPAVPAGLTLTDRVFANGTSTRSSITVQAFRLTVDGKGASAAVSFNDYAELKGYSSDTTRYLSAFSLQVISPPSLSISQSEDKSSLTIEVSGASIASGANTVSLAFAAGCTTAAGPHSETTAGSNEVKLTLAGTCAGAVTASLQTAAGMPFDPVVETVFTIQ